MPTIPLGKVRDKITGVTQTGGSTGPGATATYGLNTELNDTPIGTFSVYNGKDGMVADSFSGLNTKQDIIDKINEAGASNILGIYGYATNSGVPFVCTYYQYVLYRNGPDSEEITDLVLYDLSGTQIPNTDYGSAVTDFGIVYLKPSQNDAIFVDSALSSISENPVQNKIVTGALAKKMDGYVDNSYYATLDDLAEGLRGYPLTGFAPRIGAVGTGITKQVYVFILRHSGYGESYYDYYGYENGKAHRDGNGTWSFTPDEAIHNLGQFSNQTQLLDAAKSYVDGGGTHREMYGTVAGQHMVYLQLGISSSQLYLTGPTGDQKAVFIGSSWVITSNPAVKETAIGTLATGTQKTTLADFKNFVIAQYKNGARIYFDDGIEFYTIGDIGWDNSEITLTLKGVPQVSSTLLSGSTITVTSDAEVATFFTDFGTSIKISK